MATKSVLKESRQIERAVALIQLGARLQVLESETDLSYERLPLAVQGAAAVFHRLVPDLAAQHPRLAVHQYLRVPEQSQRAGRH
jgi:hypothetical protein